MCIYIFYGKRVFYFSDHINYMKKHCFDYKFCNCSSKFGGVYKHEAIPHSLILLEGGIAKYTYY